MILVVSGLIVILVAYTCLCELRGSLVTRWNSNAWSSQLRWNRHIGGLEFQLVLYQVFHVSWWSRLNHLSLLVDGILWLQWIRIQYGTGIWILLLFVQFAAQTASYYPAGFSGTSRNWRAILFITSCYVGLSFFPLPGDVMLVAPIGLILLPFVRAVGHALWERGPPLLFGNNSLSFSTESPSGVVFLKYLQSEKNLVNIFLAIVWSPIVGWVSELQAGLPFRLLPITIISTVHSDWILPSQIKWESIQHNANQILTKGWPAWQVTRNLYK
jgi:hypothetical protein